MDEHRGRHEAYARRDQHHRGEPPPPIYPPEPAPSQGLLDSFGIGGEFLEEYLPILLILLGALGVYLLLGKQGGILGGFLK